MTLKEEVKFNIKIGQQFYLQSFYVANATSDMNLGVNFMNENSVVIDLPKNSLLVRENQSDLCFSYDLESTESIYKLCLPEAIETPPNSELILTTKLNSDSKVRKETRVAICEPLWESEDVAE